MYLYVVARWLPPFGAEAQERENLAGPVNSRVDDVSILGTGASVIEADAIGRTEVPKRVLNEFQR